MSKRGFWHILIALAALTGLAEYGVWGQEKAGFAAGTAGIAGTTEIARKDERPDLAEAIRTRGMTAPTKVVHLYPKGQHVDEGIIENGIEITLGPGEANRTDTTEFYWDRDGSLNAVGDSARIVLYLPQLSRPADEQGDSLLNSPGSPHSNNARQSTGDSPGSPHSINASPASGNGQMILICPGGGYNELMFRSEGTYAAQVLTAKGYSVGIVCYRMPTGHASIPLTDVQNAFRYCRYHAKEWGITQIGIMGMSAGGHLAACASTLWTDAVTRPDFAVLFYPVVSADPALIHRGSYRKLTGLDRETIDAVAAALASSSSPARPGISQAERWPIRSAMTESASAMTESAPAMTGAAFAEACALIERYTPDRNVTPGTPPTLLLHSIDDGVNPAQSLSYFAALTEAGVPAELHIFPQGGHGWGFNVLETAGRDRLGSSRNVFYAALFSFLESLQDGTIPTNQPRP